MARDTAASGEVATATTTTTAGDVTEKDTVPGEAAAADISGTGPVMDAAMIGEAEADTKVVEAVGETSQAAEEAEAEVAGEEDAEEEVTVIPPHVLHPTNLTEC